MDVIYTGCEQNYIHEDFTKIPGKDITRLTSACDKQFVSLDDFRDNAVKSLEREK